jgi:hypothetical protein
MGKIMYTDINDFSFVEADTKDGLQHAIIDMMDKVPGTCPWGQPVHLKEKRKWGIFLVTYEKEYLA